MFYITTKKHKLIKINKTNKTNKTNKINKKVNNSIINMNNKKTILILSGGSIKGIAHLGGIKVLEEKNIMINIKTIIGTSIGGIIGCLLLIGYTADELFEFINLLDLNILKNIDMNLFLDKYGADNRKNFIIVLEKMFELKNININITLNELYMMTKKKLILTTVCINEKKLYYLSYKTHPNLSVITALCMTSSLPLWFIPVSYEDKLFIDGGIMNNYPINLCMNKLHKVIGFYIDTKENDTEIKNIESYIMNIMMCISRGLTQNALCRYKQTIKIIIPIINIFDLNLSKQIKQDLYNVGYECVNKYIDKNKNKK